MKKCLSIFFVFIYSGFSFAQTAYITNALDNTVSVIDCTTDSVIKTIPVGPYPTAVSVSPNGKKVYIANAGTNTLFEINTITNVITDTIYVGQEPQGICLSPDGRKIYTGNETDCTVSVVDTSTNTVIATIPVGTWPCSVAITPDGSKLYVSNYGDTTISVINTANNTVSGIITIGCSSTGLVVSKDGSKLYVSLWTDYANNKQLCVINTQTDNILYKIIDGDHGSGISISPDGSKIYHLGYISGLIYIVDAFADTVSCTIPIEYGAEGISVTPDGNKVYVAEWGNTQGGTVSVISTTLNAVVETIQVGNAPVAFGNFISIYSQHSGHDTINEDTISHDSIILVQVYPNPANENIIIESPRHSTIEIFNAIGQLIRILTTDYIKTNVDVSNLASGIYIVVVRTENDIGVKKFVKER